MASIAENSQGIITRGSRPYFEVSTGYTYLEENDLLFSKITPCLQNGKHALATDLEGEFGFGTTEFHVVRAGSSLAAPFMSRVLTQAHIIDHCAKSFTGTAGQQRVQPETVNALPNLLPPLPEQQAIAAVLDSIDDTIESTQAVIAPTEQLRDSLLHQLLTRGVPGWHTEWKEVPDMGTIPADWDVVRLVEVAGTITSGSRAWSRYFRPDGAFFVRSQNIVGGKIDHSDVIWVEPPLGSEAERTRINEGDILISITGEPGKATVADRNLGQAFVSQHVALVRLRDRRHRNYLKTSVGTGGGTRAGRTPVGSGPCSSTLSCHIGPRSPGTSIDRLRCAPPPSRGPDSVLPPWRPVSPPRCA